MSVSWLYQQREAFQQFVPCRFVQLITISSSFQRVPNLQDIATWIGNRPKDKQVKSFQFGDEYRPCPLEKVSRDIL